MPLLPWRQGWEEQAPLRVALPVPSWSHLLWPCLPIHPSPSVTSSPLALGWGRENLMAAPARSQSLPQLSGKEVAPFWGKGIGNEYHTWFGGGSGEEYSKGTDDILMPDFWWRGVVTGQFWDPLLCAVITANGDKERAEGLAQGAGNCSPPPPAGHSSSQCVGGGQ